MNKNLKLSVVALSLLLIVMSVGYAAYSVVLTITGTSTISASAWDVHFENIGAGVNDTVLKMVTPTTAPTISADKHDVTFAVTLNVGEEYAFIVDDKNAGTIEAYLDTYNVVVDGTTYNSNKWNNNYLSYAAVWTDTGVSFAQGNTLAAGASRNVTVTVRYEQPETSSDLPSTDATHTFVVHLNWIQGNYLKSGELLAKTNTINFDAGAYTLSETSRSITNGNSVGTLPTVSGIPDGYGLAGWYTDNTYTTKVTEDTIPTGSTTYYAKITTAYKDTVLNGANPAVATDMVPVTIANDGTVTYANIYDEWYNYTNKTWANAAKLIASPSKTYKAGDTISEADIETYLVWIPRYKYELWNVGVSDVTSSQVPKTIPVTFESSTTAKSTGSTDGTYLTHPAFTWGSTELNGIWVSKFEVTGSISAVTSKPKINPLVGERVGGFWNALKAYDTKDLSHMMKNTEWGAVAYLTTSIYGKNSEVYINNDSNRITGCGGTTASAASTTSCTNAYASVTNYPQSTTGNISGIFDMSGGALEYMAAYRSGSVGTSSLTVDTINANSNYFDIYNSSSTGTSYNYRILGDATGEMGPITSLVSSWYHDYANFVSASGPWFWRGGYYDDTNRAGMFFFWGYEGRTDLVGGSRMVLSPE